MNKRLIALIAALGLLLSLTAAAEPTVYDVTDRYLDLDTDTGLIMLEDTNHYYILATADGVPLSDASAKYTSMSDMGHTPFFKVEVASEDGIHDEGVIDASGREIVPPVYADVSAINDHWVTGVKLVASSADDKDYTFTNYSTNEKFFFRIDTVDFFYDGQKVGTLDRSLYDGYPGAHGAYVQVTTREKQRRFYDAATFTGVDAEYSTEFTEVYQNGKYSVIHNPTGQTAFAPGCTVDPATTERGLWHDHGVLYDVQGNVAGESAHVYDYVTFNEGYYSVKFDGKYGVMDGTGAEIIPVAFDGVGYNLGSLDYGYLSVVIDGKFGFVDAQGNVTCQTSYAEDIVRDKGTFATVQNLDGSTIVLSAAVGELSEHFADTYFANSDGCRAFVATNAAGEKAVIGLNGEALIPFSADYKTLTVSRDGTTVLAGLGGRTWKIFRFDPSACDVSGAAPAPEAPEAEAAPEAEPEAPADEPETWTCENGHEGNTGKFCTECGAPRPEPAEDDGTWTCENGHEGNTGNFCPECGAAKP